jgi:hypothetical protein
MSGLAKQNQVRKTALPFLLWQYVSFEAGDLCPEKTLLMMVHHDGLAQPEASETRSYNLIDAG